MRLLMASKSEHQTRHSGNCLEFFLCFLREKRVRDAPGGRADRFCVPGEYLQVAHGRSDCPEDCS